MSKTSLVFRGVKFDSDEEVFFAMWLEELKEVGIVSGWKKCVHPIVITSGLKIPYKKVTQLKTKTKTETKYKRLLNPSEYTPDFMVSFTNKGFDLLCSFIDKELLKPEALFFTFDKVGQGACISKTDQVFTFEVKPSFDQQNMERLFVNNQKFIWETKQIFINLIEPVALFEKTFLPFEAEPYFRYKVLPKKAIAKGKKKGDFKFDWKPKTLNEFLKTK